jgi:lipoic acid synthetase
MCHCEPRSSRRSNPLANLEIASGFALAMTQNQEDLMPVTPTRERVNPETTNTTPLRRPEWIKVRAPAGETYERLQTLMRSKALHTVCEEAMCPNMGECWGSGTATFLMLGDVCTRTCGFCDIKHGRPEALDWLEPERVAQAVKSMNLKHAVITSVNRDDRRDGGAPIFAMVIRRIRELLPGCSVEVLIPDFKGSLEALKIVMDARPEILNHNVETVPRLFKQVQPQDHYEWSAAILSGAKKLDPEVLTKSGIMVGLGEELEEVKAVMRDQRAWGVDILTDSTSSRAKNICRLCAITRWKSSKRFATTGARLDSGGLSLHRWCGRRIMPRSR